MGRGSAAPAPVQKVVLVQPPDASDKKTDSLYQGEAGLDSGLPPPGPGLPSVSRCPLGERSPLTLWLSRL